MAINWICPAPLHPPTVTFTTVVPAADEPVTVVAVAVIVVVYPPGVALVSVLPVSTLRTQLRRQQPGQF
ncbi:hypothetical protein DPMN_190281 [Dreissena polymorpha]|uniref:Uncharacterized protein n=1 Tax=Dreissena polymorpha TaxID=45954 RepID=A0A9D4DV39_DREPO|nr:hypothetical protein DPMN_190281 [Dreissena polymorpha]